LFNLSIDVFVNNFFSPQAISSLRVFMFISSL
jgi:hypothetical protein